MFIEINKLFYKCILTLILRNIMLEFIAQYNNNNNTTNIFNFRNNSLFYFVTFDYLLENYGALRKRPSWGVILRESNPYLRKKIQGSGKNTENSERIDRLARLGSNPDSVVYQF